MHIICITLQNIWKYAGDGKGSKLAQVLLSFTASYCIVILSISWNGILWYHELLMGYSFHQLLE